MEVTLTRKSNISTAGSGLRTLILSISFLILLQIAIKSESPSIIADIGSRLELFVDDFLIEKMDGAALKLHSPIAKEVAIVFDEPWEGNTSAYVTVFPDEGVFRMYYRGSSYDPQANTYSDALTCYAESKDGTHWTKPELGLFDYMGSKKNNIVWNGIGTHNFTPFKDTNPACPADERYKALGTEKEQLYAFKSSDGLHWSLLQPEPVLLGYEFDSQNLAFWDSARGKYLEFHRGWRDKIRDIMMSSSRDFRAWEKPVWLDWGVMSPEHLYTNAIVPYFRAPHILIGFPKRFMPERKAGEHKLPGVSDAVFMSSRDGQHWKRWGEAFIRPGLQKERWVNRNNMVAWGILVTKSDIPGLPDELSIYSSEGYYVANCRMRRHVLRLDGFVSINAPLAGGEIVTKPLRFSGRELVLNFSTSGAGSIRVEIQDENGRTVKDFGLEDCPEIYGDDIEYMVKWKSAGDVSGLAGKPVRLRFVMKDADLYSIRFN
jgi:hypothetical protein